MSAISDSDRLVRGLRKLTLMAPRTQWMQPTGNPSLDFLNAYRLWAQQRNGMPAAVVQARIAFPCTIPIRVTVHAPA